MGESFFDKFRAKENLNDNNEATAASTANTANNSAHDSLSEFAEARERLNSETAEEVQAVPDEINDSPADVLSFERANVEVGDAKEEESDAFENVDSSSDDVFDENEESEDFLTEDFSTDDAEDLNSDDFKDEDESLKLNAANLGYEKAEPIELKPDMEFAEIKPAAESVQALDNEPRNQNAAEAFNADVAEPTKEPVAESTKELPKENPSDDLKEQFKQRKIANFFSKIDMDCTMPNLSSAEIADRAEQAKLYGLSSVCILASRMKMFKKQAEEQNFCAVIAYPSGEMTEKSKICEIREAAKHGAREIDLFFRISALKDEKRKQIVKSLKKYRFVIGKKKIFKISVDSALISADEAEFIVEAVREAKIDYIVVHNCGNDERTRLFYSGLCAGKCKLEFADSAVNLALAEKLTAIGAERFLLREAISVADSMREEINRE